MVYYVYLFTFPNGKHYVGRTYDYEKRMVGHKHKAKMRKKQILYYAINKYGWDNINKQIIDEVYTLEDAIKKEYERIVEYNSVINGYNSTFNTKDGGDVWMDRKDTDEYSSFIEYMKTITNGENNGMYGKKHSSKSIAMQKEKAKGRYSLQWFIERYGDIEGTKKYEDRRAFLKNRNMKRSSDGKFAKVEQ